MNVLKHHGILAGPMGRTGNDVAVFIGNSALPVLATQGGLVEHLVKLNDKVDAGQKVAIQRNSFGEVVAVWAPIQATAPNRITTSVGIAQTTKSMRPS
jgi:predicted deacylase